MAQKSRKRSKFLAKKKEAQMKKEFQKDVDELVEEISELFWTNYLIELQVRVIFYLNSRIFIKFIIQIESKRLCFGKLGQKNSMLK